MGNGLLIIDMQNYFFRAPEKRIRYTEMTGAINQLIQNFDASPDSHVFHVVSEHKADKSTWSQNMKRKDSGCLLEGSEEARIVKEMKQSADHTIVRKTRHSAFMRTDLERRLLEKGIDRIVLCGMYTHGCIALTAVDGWSLDFEVIIAQDCIFSHRKDLSEFIVERLKNMLKIEFLSNRMIIEKGLASRGNEKHANNEN
jgi:nicotinamidase-related amidase